MNIQLGDSDSGESTVPNFEQFASIEKLYIVYFQLQLLLWEQHHVF